MPRGEQQRVWRMADRSYAYVRSVNLVTTVGGTIALTAITIAMQINTLTKVVQCHSEYLVY